MLINPYRFGGLWTPANIATALWLDAADASTVTVSSGLISQVNDKSGNARNFTASGSARPTYTSGGLGGLPVFTFGGSQRFTSINSAATWNFLHNANGSTVWFIAKTGNSSNPLTSYGYLGTNGGASANVGRSFYYYDDASANNRIVDFATRGIILSNSMINNFQNDSLVPNTVSLLSIVGDPGNPTAANRSFIRINGNSPIANNTLTNSPPAQDATFTLQIGDLGNNDSRLVGFIAEVIIQSNVAATATVQLVEGYLAHKWGLAANLPSGHPYKSAAPTI